MVAGAGGLFEVNRRAAHPHMNNLVYGRRSAPSTASQQASPPLLAVASMYQTLRKKNFKTPLNTFYEKNK